MRIALVATIVLLAHIVTAQDGWRLDNPSALWLQRDSHTVTVFNGRMWVVNGYGGSTLGSHKDIWSSADGHVWDLEVAEVPWTGRHGHATVSMGGRLWVIGGWYFGYKNDVWSSSDGTNWSLETAAAPWTPRSRHTVVAFGGKLWLMGGLQGQQFLYNDVWSSPDGVNWTFETNAPWTLRSNHASVVFDSRIWVVGGVTWSGSENDVWSSPDGVNWAQETASASWNARGEHTLEVFGGRMWLAGGYFSHPSVVGHNLNDAWSTSDGANWTQKTFDAAWSARSSHASASFNGRLWILGGSTQVDNQSDVWSYGLHASPDVLPDGVVGHPYSASLEAREGDGPFVWALTGGSLPPGLVLDTSTTAATLPITGTPSQVGTFQFTIHLTDDNGYTNEQQITIQINPPKPLQNESSSSTGCALQHVPIPAWLLLPATVAWFRRRRRLYTT